MEQNRQTSLQQKMSVHRKKKSKKIYQLSEIKKTLPTNPHKH